MSWLGAPTHRTATTWTATAVGGCVRVRECVRVRAFVRVCVHTCVRVFAICDTNI